MSLYQAAAAMNASSRWQEVVSENLAAGSIPGYKKQEVSFSSIAPSLPTQPGGHSYPLVKAQASTSFAPGEIHYTGANTDFAVEGNGFFQVQLPNGTTGYTRNGQFQINSKGQLTTTQGYPVMGQGGPIQLGSANGGPVTVSPTGEVTRGTEPKGKLKIVSFTDPSVLNQASGGLFTVDPNSSEKPTDVANPNVRQGFLEAANTSSVAEMASLMTAMRSFEINQKVVQAQDDRMGKAITELGTPAT